MCMINIIFFVFINYNCTKTEVNQIFISIITLTSLFIKNYKVNCDSVILQIGYQMIKTTL